MFRSSNPHNGQSPASRTTKMRARTVLFFGLSLATAAVAADFPLPPCESPREVRDFLMSRPSDDANVPYALRQTEAGQRLATMIEKYPRDLALHQARRTQLIGPMYRTWKAPIVEYRALMEKHPGDPLHRFLYGKMIFGTNTREAIRIHESVLAEHSGFAPAHLELAAIYQSFGVFKDTVKSLEHREAYRKACPEAANAFSASLGLNDQAYFERSAHQLRKILEATPDSDQDKLTAYQTLWTMEFRGRPASGHEALRKQVAVDVARLKAITAPQGSRWLQLLQSGYRLVNQTAEVDRIDARMLEMAPRSRDAMRAAQSSFYAKHSYPRTGKAEDEKAWARQLLEASRDWVTRWPGAVSPHDARFSSIALLEETPLDEFHTAADALLERYERQPDEFTSLPPLHYRVAEAYLKRGTRFERVAELVAAGTAELGVARERDHASDTEPPEERRDGSYGIWFQDGAPMRITAHLRLSQPNEAKRVLREMDEYHLANRPQGKDAQSTTDFRNATLWTMRGRIAEAEKRTADAVVLYLRAGALQRTPLRPGPHRVNAGERARDLWKQMGGTAEGLQAMMEANAFASGGDSLEWKKASLALPDFEITDTAGRVWRLADLKGKRTFINLWATWCGWCHPELPEVQKLYEETKGRQDVVVLSMNLDDNPGLIGPYMAEKGFAFPVLPALALVDKLGLELSLPRNWIAGPDGKLMWEQHGFSIGEPPSEWLRKRALELMGTAALAK